ncbi:Rhodanese-like domain containing protein [Novymonas esmeraldas]|uniref:Rhodanese-like domain containing protein n=1 Tax=Novymonas esmeraldas TaxID=1808958 RepID=A0AAW0ET19_9TRYP
MMIRATQVLSRYVSIDQVSRIVRAKHSGSDAVRHVQLIDVRSTAEVAATGLIPSAVNIPLPVLRDVLDEAGVLDEAEFESVFGAARPVRGVTQIVFYCAHGVRSAIACDVAEELGFENAGNFSGSWAQWHYTYGAVDSPEKAPHISPIAPTRDT